MSRGIGRFALGLLGALAAGGALGCELIAGVDRSRIPDGTAVGGGDAGGSGGGTNIGGGGAAPGCGDGAIDAAAGEICDDGNAVAGDGCGLDCKVEIGFLCTGEPSACKTKCGDGAVAGKEACDDKNANPGDGCSAACEVESGYSCDGQPSQCTTVCGDGVLAGMEACDDENANSGDGCDASCGIEDGFSCDGQPSVCATICGDGLIAGTETCDDGDGEPGDGCDAGCAIEAGWACAGAPSACVPVCGDGIIAGGEACDDGNTQSLDGCSKICKLDVFSEAEPNDTPATANGPFSPDVLIKGTLVPGADVDFFLLDIPSTVDLRVETFDASGPGSCLNIDTIVTLYGSDGATILAADDDDGEGRCSRISTEGDAAVRHLPEGQYWVKVASYDPLIAIKGYSLAITFDARCGDGTKEGFEECDGGAGCQPGCDRVPLCGDGFVDAPEECDDENGAYGDGCDSSCKYELLIEEEPNDDAATAFGPFVPPSLFAGSISPAGDVDYYMVTIPATADLSIDSFDALGPGSCAGIDTVLTLFGPDGVTPLISRDQGGVGSCAAIVSTRDADAGARRLPAGTYYIRAEDWLNDGEIPEYRLLVTLDALCGDGVVSGAEECEGGPDCDANCERVPSCGDGFVDAPESCDDGNVIGNDGCAANCQLELTPEVEPNGTPQTASGPAMPHVLWSGAIAPVADVDYYAFTIPATADVRVETFDGAGPGSCAGIDTVVTLYASNGIATIALKDDGGIGKCSKIDPKGDVGARHLFPGTYYIKVEDAQNNSQIPSYTLEVTMVARCGDGMVEGFEECDGGPGCDANCNRTAICGDGYVDLPETCDDGNTTPGDGCAANCQIEAAAEVEPNDSVAAASVQLTKSGYFTGAIGQVGDKDFFKLSLAGDQVVRLETFFAGSTDCSVIATTLRLFDAQGQPLYTDDNSGVGACSALVVNLPAGVYYVSVEERDNDATIPTYVLQAKLVPGAGAEVEVNDTKAQANPLAGPEVFIAGGHLDNLDSDFYAITIPAGKGLRAEIVEGGAETCESAEIDSRIALYDAKGLELGDDDDAGRGYCSRIDGTGAFPANDFAGKLPAGTYYLEVAAAPFAQTPGDSAGQFDYRLIVTVR